MNFKVIDKLKENNIDGLLLTDPGNMGSVAGFTLPFPYHNSKSKSFLLLQKSGSSVFISLPDICQAVEKQSVSLKIEGLEYVAIDENGESDNSTDIVSALIKYLKAEGGVRTLGIEKKHLSVNCFARLKSESGLERLVGFDGELEEIRLIKTPEEVEKIKIAAKTVDMGFVGALNHIEGTVGLQEYTMAEVAERIRVHAMEFESCGAGYFEAAQKESLKNIYAQPSSDFLQRDTYLRMELASHYQGLWARGARTVYSGLGNPPCNDYEKLIMLSKYVYSVLEPGVVIDEVITRIYEYAASENIRIYKEPGLGHGLGWSEIEPPYLVPGNESKLETGMVLSIGVYILNSQGEILHNRELWGIGEKKSFPLSVTRSWDELYRVDGFRTTH